MALNDSLQYHIENISLWFQGGVRRSVIIFVGVSLLLLAPLYFGGQLVANAWSRLWLDSTHIVQPKSLIVREYSTSETNIVELADGSRDLYLSVANKENRDVGFFPWIYTLKVLNASGSVLSQETIRSYLLPDETKFIVARSTDPNARKLQLIQEPDTKPVFFNELARSGVRNPNVEIRQQQLTQLENGKLRIFAQFKNNDIVTVERVDILYIVRDTRQSVVGIGTFTFNRLLPGELRDLTIEYPRPASREPRNLDLRWSTNYLDENNIRFNASVRSLPSGN